MSNLIQKLIDQGVAINFKNTDFESYDKIFDILTDLNCIWFSGDSPNAIHEEYFERLVDPSRDKFLIISKNYPEPPSYLKERPHPAISIRRKSKVEELGLDTITADQFLDLANTKSLDYDDVFGQLDESSGSNNLGISETFYIDFSGATDDEIKEIFKILDENGFLWTSGDKPSSLLGRYISELKNKHKYRDLLKIYPATAAESLLILTNRHGMVDSRGRYFQPDNVYKAKKFLKQFGIEKLDYDDVFGKLDESKVKVTNFDFPEMFYINFTDENEGTLSKVFKLLDEFGFMWNSGSKPSALMWDLSNKLLGGKRVLSVYYNFDRKQKILLHTLSDILQFPHHIVYTGKEFLEKYDLDIEKLDYDDVFGKLDEARGLSKKLPKTNFSISFEDLGERDSDIYEQVFQILEMEGYLWRTGQKPTEITYKDHLFGSVRSLLNVWAKGGMGRWANNRPKTLTYGSPRSKKIFGAKEFVERFGVQKLDYDDVFGKLDESTEDEFNQDGLPKSFTISITDDGPGQVDMIVDVILRFLYNLGYSWRGISGRSSRETPAAFFEVLDEVNNAGFDTSLQINYEDEEPMIMSHGGDWHPNWTFTPKQFVKKYMDFDPLDYEDVFKILDN